MDLINAVLDFVRYIITLVQGWYHDVKEGTFGDYGETLPFPTQADPNAEEM